MRSPFGVAGVMVSEFESEFGSWNQTACHLRRHRHHRVLVLGFKLLRCFTTWFWPCTRSMWLAAMPFVINPLYHPLLLPCHTGAWADKFQIPNLVAL
jgi:hypothetical protein